MLTASADDIAVRMASPCQGEGSFAVPLDKVAKAAKSQGVLAPAKDSFLAREAERLSGIGFGDKKRLVSVRSAESWSS